MVPLSMILSDLWPGFQGHDIFEVECRKKTARLKDKVTIAQDEKYLTYGMVLCLVTLTDL